MKQDLIILHGALGCKEQFNGWAGHLASNFNCHLFDLPGHGSRSEDEVDFSIERFSSELTGYIKNAKLVQQAVLGYSMGGYVALYTAMQHPGCMGNIMTLATKFDWNSETSKREAGYLNPEIMLQKVPTLAEQLKQRHGAQWENVVRRTADMMIMLGEKPLLTPQNILSIMNKIKFCVGEKDKMVSVVETEAMYKGARNGILKILPVTGHLPETMDTRLIVVEIESFFLPGAAN